MSRYRNPFELGSSNIMFDHWKLGSEVKSMKEVVYISQDGEVVMKEDFWTQQMLIARKEDDFDRLDELYSYVKTEQDVPDIGPYHPCPCHQEVCDDEY